MRQIHIDALQFRWVAGDPACASQATESITNILHSNVHRELWRSVNNIIFYNKRAANDKAYAEKLYGKGTTKDFVTGADALGGTVVAYKRPWGDMNMSVGTFAHEAAHAFVGRKWNVYGVGIPPEHTAYAKAFNTSGEDYITNYAKDSAAIGRGMSEDFAEASMMYATNPEGFKRRFPQKYAAFHLAMTEGK